MFILFSLLFAFLSVDGSSADKRPFPSKESQEAAITALKDAIVTYAHDPIPTIITTLTIKTPFSSDTHKALSEVLSNYRSGTAFRKPNAGKVICDIENYGSEPLSNVRSSLVSVLKRCFPGEYSYLKTWEDILDEVRNVYNEHAPPNVKMGLLNKKEDAYSFLVFLLMHFKLKFNEASISDNERNPSQSLKTKKRRTRKDRVVAEESNEELSDASYVPETPPVDMDAAISTLYNRKTSSRRQAGNGIMLVTESTLNNNSPKSLAGTDLSSLDDLEHDKYLSTDTSACSDKDEGGQLPSVSTTPELPDRVDSSQTNMQSLVSSSPPVPPFQGISTALKELQNRIVNNLTNFPSPMNFANLYPPSQILQVKNSFTSLPEDSQWNVVEEEGTREAIKVLKDAIVAYASDPIRTSYGRLTMSIPSSSPTHEALSKVLSKFPSLNGFDNYNTNMLFEELGTMGYCSTLYNRAFANVKWTLVPILEKCSPGDYGYINSWDSILDAARKVYKEHAPPEANKKLISTSDDAFSFIVFVLVHFKLYLPEISKVAPLRSTKSRQRNRGRKRKATSEGTEDETASQPKKVKASQQNTELDEVSSAPISYSVNNNYSTNLLHAFSHEHGNKVMTFLSRGDQSQMIQVDDDSGLKEELERLKQITTNAMVDTDDDAPTLNANLKSVWNSPTPTFLVPETIPIVPEIYAETLGLQDTFQVFNTNYALQQTNNHEGIEDFVPSLHSFNGIYGDDFR